MTIEFCNFSASQISGLKRIFSTIYEISDFSEIMSIYDVFKKDFPGPTISAPQTIERRKMLPKTNQSDFLDKFKNFDYQVGIDLPVLLKPESNSKETVFIVAEDPLRDFYHLSNEIRLTTPFAVHMKDYRDKKLRVYWQVITHILNQNVSVYVTDIYKLWIKSKWRSKLKFRGDLYDNFNSAFQKEMEIFNPQLIVTFGKPAESLAESLTTSVKRVPFPHLTGTANGKWKEIFNDFYKDNNVRCTYDNKVRYIKCLLESTCSITKVSFCPKG